MDSEEPKSIVQIIKENAEFNPPLYGLFSKKINENIKVEHDAFYQIYFISEKDHKLNFRIHELEFSSPSEWLCWQRVSLKKKDAVMNGIYTPFGTFYGSIKTEDRNLDVITKNHRLVKLRTWDEKIRDMLPLIYFMTFSKECTNSGRYK